MANKMQLWEYLRRATKYSYNLWFRNSQDTDNMLSLLRAIQNIAASGNFETPMNAAIDAQISTLSGLFTQSSSILNPLLIELSRFYGGQSSDPNQALADIAVGMADLGETVTSRGFVNGVAVPGGSNAGNGNVYRLELDQYGFVIESGYANAGNVTLRCAIDKHSGAQPGSESFDIFGDGVVPSNQLELGNVFPGAVIANSVDPKVNQLIGNSSFEQATLDSGNFTANDNLNSWVMSDFNNFAINTTDYFRPDSSGQPSQSLRFTGNGNVTQSFRDNGISIDPSRPTPAVLHFKKSAVGVAGTLTLEIGNKSVNVDLSTITNDTWNPLVFGISNSDGWFRNYNITNTAFTVSVSGLTGGDVSIDDIVFQYPTFVDGKHVLVVPGTQDWLRDDEIVFTDTVANAGKTQLILSRSYGRYLPHIASGATYEDL